MTISLANKITKEAILDLTSEQGFKIKSTSTGLEVKRERKWAVDIVGFGFANFFGDVEALGFSMFIGFPYVEMIVDPILSKNGKKGVHDPVDPYCTFDPPFQAEHKISDRIPIHTEKDLDPIINKFELFFRNDVIPCLEKWKDLKTISEFLNDIPQMDVEDYISIYKKAVIWKLCNNPRYEEYINYLYHGMRKRYKDDPSEIRHKRAANAITELKAVLDKTDPIM